MPRDYWSILPGRAWILIGSLVYFGGIAAIVTAYFTRPLHRPLRQIVDTIEYKLDRLNKLSVEELELLKQTTDAVIEQMERLKLNT